MEQVIKVKTSDLRTAAKEFDSAAGKMYSSGQKMVGLINEFSKNVWTGEAKTKYSGKLKGLEDDITRVKTTIHNLAEDLGTAASNYETTETENVAMAESLKTDVIK